MAQNTPPFTHYLDPLAGLAKYNQVVNTVIKTLEGTGVAGFAMTIPIRTEIVEIQILGGIVVYTTDGQDPTVAGAGFRWKVSGNEAWAQLSRQEAKALKVIALTGESPTLNIAPKAFAIKQ